MSLIRKHVAVLQAWACLDLVCYKCWLIFKTVQLVILTIRELFCNSVIRTAIVAIV